MPAAIEGHVPAWKRLGLRLKYATEEATPATESSPVPATQETRKFETADDIADLDHASERPSKRARRSTAQFNHASTTKLAPITTSLSPTTPLKPSLNRKSVSFTPETKTEDGDSTKDLYNSWIASQKASDPSFDPSSFKQDALHSITPLSLNPTSNSSPTTFSTPSQTIKQTQKKTKKKKKKRNKSKSTTLSSNPHPSPKPPTSTSPSHPTPPTTHPALTYLHTHHTSPAAWKFSKSRSSYLLRHLFSPSHIPPSYNEALQSYLQGLESQGARRRIVGQALQIRKEDEEWLLAKDDEGGASGWWKGLEVGGEGKMDDPKKRKEVFMRAVAEHEECLRAHADAEEEAEKDRVWRERVEKRRRAEMVLGIFGEGGGGAAQVGDDGKDVVRNDVNGGAVVAGRKRLSSPGGLGNPKPKRKRKRRRTGVPDDESSSSSSSSGSSDDSSSSQSEDEDNSSAGMGKPVNGRTAVAIPNGTINKGATAVDLTAETDTSSSEESSDSESDTSSTTGSSESGSSSSDG